MNPGDNSPTGDLEAPLISAADPVVPRAMEDCNSLLRSVFTFKNFYLILGPLLCAAVCFWVIIGDGNTGKTSRNMLGILAWIFTWWLTEAVPVPITSLAPLFLFPLFGISDADTVARSYFDDVITLVIGSFILALSVEHYNIHRRLALNITLLFCGDPLNQQILLLGICGTTTFVSMWMHNVAAAMMMVPVATGVLQRLPSGPENPAAVSNFCKAVVLGVIYSAAIGGMCTLTGTGVNLILVGMWKTYFPDHNAFTFSTWLIFGLPLGIFLFVSLWAILCLVFCRNGSGQALSQYLDKAHLKKELETLGTISFEEKTILGLFIIQIVLWMTRNITESIPGWGALFNGRAGDGTVSVVVATLLFIIPTTKRTGEKIMDWNKCKKLHWNIILLLGAGFAIADGVRTSGLATVLSKALDFLEAAPYWAIAPAVGLVASTITEFTSNNATATLLIPLLIQLAVPMQVHPAILVIPATIGAQFAFLLPTGTPSNLIGFTTGHIEIKDMLLVGCLLKIVGLIFLSLLMPTLGAYVFVES